MSNIALKQDDRAFLCVCQFFCLLHQNPIKDDLVYAHLLQMSQLNGSWRIMETFFPLQLAILAGQILTLYSLFSFSIYVFFYYSEE